MHNPFSLSQVKNPVIKWALQKISRINMLEQFYDSWLKQGNNPDDDNTDAFLTHILNQMQVDTKVINEELLAAAPTTGPLIIVANHPLGGIDGMVLTKLLRTIRPDLKVLTNELLSNIHEFRDVFVGVDVLNAGKQRHNMQGMRVISRHLSNNGALLVFPAGTVSRIKLPSFKVSDAPWSDMISKLARKYKAPIMPIYVGGKNSLSFYLAGYIHKRLRTALLPRAMVNNSAKTVDLHLGALIPASDLQRLHDDRIAMSYIRMCCEVLNSPQPETKTTSPLPMQEVKRDIANEEVANHITQSLSEYRVHQKGNLELYCAPYDALGIVMEQLSIERERTFRQVDEGTGYELDSDRFDPHYMHLFLWDKSASKIAGGYRLGKTDEIVKNHKLEGLYSHSLFNYQANFLQEIGKTIEVGRSFITQDYQKSPFALDLMWKGIGAFVAKNPEYHTLFGCVSISQQYSRLVRTMLAETFLSHFGVSDAIKRRVKARTPIQKMKKPWNPLQIASLSEIPVINKLVGRIDPGKSIPILIHHYLALNGRFISFTVNNGFNHSLDGLIMVDLRIAPDKYLKRYMGTEGLEKFRDENFIEEKLSEAL